MSSGRNDAKDFIKRISKNESFVTKDELWNYVLSFVFSEEETEKAFSQTIQHIFKGASFSEDFTEEQKTFLKALSIIVKDTSNALSLSRNMKSHISAGNFFVNFIGNAGTESLYAAYLTENFVLLSAENVCEGDTGSVLIDVDSMISRAIKLNAKKVVIAHNHVSSYMSYSMEDYQATLKLGAYFSSKGITLLEHFVIAGGKFHGILYDLADEDRWKNEIL